MRWSISQFSDSEYRSIFFIRYCTGLVAALISVSLFAQKPEAPVPVSPGNDGKLHYVSDAQGNRVPDFSYSGYRAGEEPIPDVPVRVVVPVTEEDATLRLQAAIDYVASLSPDKNGIRGAVLLEEGHYRMSGSLTITASGVVLRGSGMHDAGTILTGTGKRRETLVRIAGKPDRELGSAVTITDAYVPVNATRITVTPQHTVKPGDQIIIHRPSTKAWIKELGMEAFGGETGWLGWKPGQRDLYWDRKVVSVEGASVVFDAPITTALDTAYGGGSVSVYRWPGRITNTGVENMVLQSAYDESNPKDEDHRWMAITMENVRDAWVRQVTFKHFAGSAVALFETASRVTVEDCISLRPVSEIGGQRRYTFFTAGQQTLFQRIYAEYGYHDFAVGFCAPGPNAFVQCDSYLPHSFSGTIDSWASGVLFDIVNVDGEALGFSNRRQDAQGAGWSAANSMLWQCTAARMDCYRPPTAMNWAFGAWAQFAGDGYWYEPNSHIRPRSLYYAQLQDRLGKDVSHRAQLLEIETNATSSPTVEQARALTEIAKEPVLSLQEWIGLAHERQPIPTATAGVKTIDQVGYRKESAPERIVPLSIQHGWLTSNNTVLTGKQHQVQWWRGNVRPYEAAKAKPHITRFVPGRIGTGWTDDLREVADQMKRQHVVAVDHNYGLWYDRRRDDHERVRRMNGEVWPPFYELPFARSGKGTAWDGLSKYDLTRYNPWYWSRLKEFADLADQKGLILIHQHYFQHNILEAGAHWADFPWRSANNINDTGFREPPPYAGDKRIFMAGQFYDIAHPARRKLHRAYIRKCLENFSGNSSVIHLVSAEYTGPLHFVQFWLDTVIEWEKETGKQVLIGLSTTKDVQDTLLADRERSSAIDVIDIRYWHYREDGSLYAPEGGQHLAPRQHARLVKTGKQSFEQVYRAVQEYRQKHPDKAVLYSVPHAGNLDWAVFMASGSLAAIPSVSNPDFLRDAAAMKPILSAGNQTYWVLGAAEKGYIIYSNGTGPIALDLKASRGTFNVRWIDPETGRVVKEGKRIKGGEVRTLADAHQGARVIWLSRK